jgi:hypothetical protein
MSEVWVLVALTGVSAVLLKAAGPVLLGGRALPERLDGVVALLAPALLAALIATQTFADDEALVVDERVAGLGAAALALWLRAPVLVAVVVAAVVTGGLRALG